MRNLRKVLPEALPLHPTHEGATHRVPGLYMQGGRLRKIIQTGLAFEATHDLSLGSEELQVHLVWTRIWIQVPSRQAHQSYSSQREDRVR